MPQKGWRKPSGYAIDTNRLAVLGAVVRVAALKRELREIEKAFPGTAAEADRQLQRDAMAVARAAKVSQQKAAPKAPLVEVGPAIESVS